MSDEAEPLLRVVRGDPTPDEIAALVAVVAARSGTDTAPKARPSTWSAYWNSHRRPVSPGTGAWRASSLPR